MAPKKNTTPVGTAEAVEAVEAVDVTAVSQDVYDTLDSIKPNENAAAKTAEEIAKEAQKEHFRKMRELVPVTPAAPRPGEDSNYPIGVNGKLWILPKGKTSMVPRYVAELFNQAEAAKGTQRDSQAKLLEQQTGGTLDLTKMTEAQIAQLKSMLGIG